VNTHSLSLLPARSGELNMADSLGPDELWEMWYFPKTESVLSQSSTSILCKMQFIVYF